MVIGIKYCGGCNPVYNRSRQVSLLKEQFPEHQFQTASQGAEGDLWLIVCGCLRACASSDGLKARRQVIRLDSEKSFHSVQSLLMEERDGNRDETEQASIAAKPKQLTIGQEAFFTKCFYKEDVARFAALTGDVSRLHTDSDFAKNTWYQKPVVHGVLAASLISTVMGTKLPGEGTILMEEQIRFLKPVFFGDIITARVRLVSCREGKRQYVGNFAGVCENQDGEVVAAAKCRQLMTKDLFEIINPQDTSDMDEVDAVWGPEERINLHGQSDSIQ